MTTQNVAILGASPKPHRYAYQAQELLMQHQHHVFPVSPRSEPILGVPTYASLQEIESEIDTVTFYVNAQRHEPMFEQVLALKPKRLIFNPGTEDETLMQRYREHNIDVVSGCTLVMLKTGQFAL